MRGPGSLVTLQPVKVLDTQDTDRQPARRRYPSVPGSKVPSLSQTASFWDSEFQDVAPRLLASFFQAPEPHG